MPRLVSTWRPAPRQAEQRQEGAVHCQGQRLHSSASQLGLAFICIRRARPGKSRLGCAMIAGYLYNASDLRTAGRKLKSPPAGLVATSTTKTTHGHGKVAPILTGLRLVGDLAPAKHGFWHNVSFLVVQPRLGSDEVRASVKEALACCVEAPADRLRSCAATQPRCSTCCRLTAWRSCLVCARCASSERVGVLTLGALVFSLWAHSCIWLFGPPHEALLGECVDGCDSRASTRFAVQQYLGRLGSKIIRAGPGPQGPQVWQCAGRGPQDSQVWQ